MRNGNLLHNENLMSHEDIIDLFNINDNQFNCNKFVRVEFSPKSNEDLPDINKYFLRVDEESTPDWFEKCRNYVTERLKNIVSNRIITGKHSIITGGLYIVKDANIERIKSAVVIYLQNSQVNEMCDNSQINEMRGNSQINEMWSNSQINKMCDNSRVDTMYNNSRVDIMCDNSRVNRMYGNSQINEINDNSQINEMCDNSQINKMYDNSQVKIYISNKPLPKK